MVLGHLDPNFAPPGPKLTSISGANRLPPPAPRLNIDSSTCLQVSRRLPQAPLDRNIKTGVRGERMAPIEVNFGPGWPSVRASRERVMQ